MNHAHTIEGTMVDGTRFGPGRALAATLLAVLTACGGEGDAAPPEGGGGPNYPNM